MDSQHQIQGSTGSGIVGWVVLSGLLHGLVSCAIPDEAMTYGVKILLAIPVAITTASVTYLVSYFWKRVLPKKGA